MRAFPENPLRYRGRIRVGTVAIAKRSGLVCARGERGVCYEVVDRSESRSGKGCKAEGYAFIFEGGRYDSLSASEVDALLLISTDVVESMRAYRFSTVVALVDDWRKGRFSMRGARRAITSQTVSVTAETARSENSQ